MPSGKSLRSLQPRRHHYVPQFLLRQWTGEDSRLERFDQPFLSKIVVRRVHTSEVGFVDNLYTSPGENAAKAQWLETNFFQHIDNLAAKCLKKLLHSPPIEFDSKEESAWSVFIRTLFHRSPETLAATQFHGMRLWEETVLSLGSKYDQIRGPEDPLTIQEYIKSRSYNDVYRQVLETFPSVMTGSKVGQFLNDLNKMVLDTAHPCPTFLISDAIPIRTNGLAVNGGHYALPLAPRKLLVAANEQDTLDGIRRMRQKDLVTSVNRWIVEGAQRFVAATDRSQERFIRNRFGRNPIEPMSGPLPSQ